MATKKECPICGETVVAFEKTGDASKYDCPACGVFRVSGSSEDMLANMSAADRAERLADALRRKQTGALAYISED